MPHTGVWTELSRPHIRIPEAPLKQTTRLCSHSSNSVLLGWGPEARISDKCPSEAAAGLKSHCARPKEVTKGLGSTLTWRLRSKTEALVWYRERKQEVQNSWKLAQKPRIF